MTDRIEELRRAHEATTQGEWAYRPQEYDDWGVVRSGRFHICQARDPRYSNTDYLNQCRVERRDPWEANARFIALAHREWPALLDRIEALEAENARLLEAIGVVAEARDDENFDALIEAIDAAQSEALLSAMQRATSGDPT